MRADPESVHSWFEDDIVLEHEIKSALERRDPPPEIAGYEALREIGQGGQGVVYLATQVGTRRRVAIKVLRERLASAPEARRRFDREIDVAAGLRHPHLVAVFDGGATADGRPYLVMEFIEGAGIDTCPATAALRESWTRPRLASVLRLFATVCDAIQYAHQRGVIHRDLKPGNIRVDSDGVARVLDFGLAKAIGPAVTPSVTATETNARRFIGSLPWASPEQAAGRTDAIDVRSDVYALGVTLYQLVTGRFPYDVSGDLDAALHAIVNTPPTPPRRHVPGLDTDLVTIMLRALAKEPDRRYQSAGELAADLRAYLAHEPIAARRDSVWYLVRMTARRRKRTVAFVAVLLLALVASSVVSLVLWLSAERARDDAVLASRTAEDLRQAEAQASKTSSDAFELLLDSLGSVDPDLSGREARVVDALAHAASEVDRRFEREPAIRARLHDRFAALYDKLGEPGRAADEAGKAHALERLIGGPDGPRALAVGAHAAFLRHKAGPSAEAVPELERLHAGQRRILGPDDRDTLVTANYLGRCLIAVGRSKEAQAVHADALARSREHLGADDLVTIDLMEGLAHARRQLGDVGGAEGLQREAYEKRLARQGPEQTGTLSALSDLIVVLTERGKLKEAEPLQKSQYDRAIARLGPDHTITMTAANTYAKILQDLGRIDEAAPIMQKTYDTRVRILGPTHKDTLTSLANLAAIRAFQKDFAAAEGLNRQALAARIESLGPLHLETLVSYNNLAAALREQGRLEEALESFEAAARGARESLGDDHWITAVFRANHASVLTKLGRLSEAGPMLGAALEVVEAKLGPDHAHAKTVRKYMAALEEASTRPATPQAQ